MLKRRRFFRYSLRTLLLVMLVMSAWLGYRANQAAKQRRAVALVKELGGSVLYDFNVANASPVNAWPLPTILPPGVSWRTFLGWDVNNDANAVPFEDIDALKFDLDGSVLYDFDVANAPSVNAAPMPTTLPPGVSWRTFLGWDANSDGNAVPLDDSDIDIDALEINSEFAPAQIRQFRKFEFDGNLVQPKFLEQPKNTFTRIAAEPPEGPLYDLLGIDWFHSIEQVFLGRTDITDEQLGELVDALPAIQQLDLSGTHVTDVGLAHLSRLKNLKRLWLSDTQVTDAGVKDLKQALPNLNVRR